MTLTGTYADAPQTPGAPGRPLDLAPTVGRRSTGAPPSRGQRRGRCPGAPTSAGWPPQGAWRDAGGDCGVSGVGLREGPGDRGGASGLKSPSLGVRARAGRRVAPRRPAFLCRPAGTRSLGTAATRVPPRRETPGRSRSGRPPAMHGKKEEPRRSFVLSGHRDAGHPGSGLVRRPLVHGRHLRGNACSSGVGDTADVPHSYGPLGQSTASPLLCGLTRPKSRYIVLLCVEALDNLTWSTMMTTYSIRIFCCYLSN